MTNGLQNAKQSLNNNEETSERGTSNSNLKNEKIAGHPFKLEKISRKFHEALEALTETLIQNWFVKELSKYSGL